MLKETSAGVRREISLPIPLEMTSDHKVRLGEAALHMVLRKVKVDHGRAETRKQCPRTTAGFRMVLESASPWVGDVAAIDFW